MVENSACAALLSSIVICKWRSAFVNVTVINY